MILKKYLAKVKKIIRKIYYLREISKFKNIGHNVHFGSKGVFVRPEEIYFGDNIYIGPNFHISARQLFIGNNVMVGPNLVIECDNHIYKKVGKTMYELRDNRIISAVKIENDVWIGANVIILPGSIVMEGSIIGAGSIITKQLPPYSVCVGSPCKAIKTRFDKDSLREHLAQINSPYTADEIVTMWKLSNLIK